MATNRQDLHEWIDRLSEESAARLRQSVQEPCVVQGEAGEADEVYGPETVASVLAAEERLDRGEGASHEEMLKEFGLR